jgi:ABC-type iron transport system FetAB permease component
LREAFKDFLNWRFWLISIFINLIVAGVSTINGIEFEILFMWLFHGLAVFGACVFFYALYVSRREIWESVRNKLKRKE